MRMLNPKWFLWLLTALLMGGCASPHQQLLHPEQFNLTLNKIFEASWNDNGDWSNDMMDCARVWGPLFCMWVGKEKGIAELSERGKISLARQKRIISEAVQGFMTGKVPPIYSFNGLTALAFAARHLGDNESEQLCGRLLPILTPLAVQKSSEIDQRWLAGMAIVNLEYYRINPGKNEYYKKLAQSCLDKIKTARPEFNKVYEFEEWCSGFMAIAHAYLNTGDKEYKNTADRMLSSAFADTDAGQTTGQWPGRLSAVNSFCWGLLDLYEASGDIAYYTKANELLTAMLPLAYSTGTFYHDWDASNRSDQYCSGCNFMSLMVFYRFSKGNIPINFSAKLRPDR